MHDENEDVFYYLTTENESYAQPPLPAGPGAEGVREGILKGLYRLSGAPAGSGPRVHLLGSGSILNQVIAAVDLLARYGVGAGRLVGDQLHGVAPRRRGRGTLEHAAPAGGAARALRDAATRRGPPARRRRQRLPQVAAGGTVSKWLPSSFTALGDGRLRAQRHARGVARLLRGSTRPTSPVAALHALAAEGRVGARPRAAARSMNSASTPTAPNTRPAPE